MRQCEAHSDLKLAGLRIRVHGRQFPDARDGWDGSWLDVTAQCDDNGASVFARGPILQLPELERWCREIETLFATLAGAARLDCRERIFSVVLEAGARGQITMAVSITPDHLTQRHWFQFAIDQSYLPSLIEQCRAILEAYPPRGERTA